MNRNQIKLNVKQNQSIWALFDKKDEMKFTQIPGLMLQNQGNQLPNNNLNFQENAFNQNKNIGPNQDNIINNKNAYNNPNITFNGNNNFNIENNQLRNYGNSNENTNYNNQIPCTESPLIPDKKIDYDNSNQLVYNNNYYQGNNNPQVNRDYNRKFTYDNQTPFQKNNGYPNIDKFINNDGFNDQQNVNPYPNLGSANGINASNPNLIQHSFN